MDSKTVVENYRALNTAMGSAINMLYEFMREKTPKIAAGTLSRKIRIHLGYLGADGKEKIKSMGTMPDQLRKDISRIVRMLDDLDCACDKYHTLQALRTAHKAWSETGKDKDKDKETETETVSIPADMILVSRVEYEALLAFWNANNVEVKIPA